MWVELLLLLFVVGLTAIGWRVVQRPTSGAATYWMAGWLAAGVGGILGVVRDAFPWLSLLGYPLGSLFATLLLAGALVFAARPVPAWLLPLALVYGLARAGFVAAGLPGIALVTGLTLEPSQVLAAAWIVHCATPRPAIGLSQRLLAPSIAVLAVAGAIHVAWFMHESTFPPGLLAMWVVAVPPLFGIQIHAEWDRGRRALERVRDALEERVSERTAELARANAWLRKEIAERRSVELALRQSEERHRVVSELGSDLAFGFRMDAPGVVSDRWASDAFTRITGYALAEVKEVGWLVLIHPEDRERSLREFQEFLARGERTIESRIIAKSGRVVAILAALRVVRDAEVAGFRVIGAARDVTAARRSEEERRRLEHQVLEAKRLESLALLTGGVAHDFNNLLAVILGNSRMALADASPDSPLHSRLARIRAAAQLGAGLTEQMLAYSGKSGVTLKPLDLSHLVDEMSDLLGAAVSERCRLELALAPHAAVEGDSTQLRQVVLNLVTNASEALRDGVGALCVRTGSVRSDARELAASVGAEDLLPGDYVFLEVSDDGLGMDATTQSHIFEPFFTTKFSGRGLGLAGVLGIVRAHRGVVQVRSEVGVGTCVRVLLPELAVALAAVAAAPSERAAERRCGTILVVDDQDYVVEIAQAFLERAGHRVLTASGGLAAIACFRERGAEIDAVLLDLTMPDASGEEVLAELQRLRPDVRVIIATGYSAEAAQRLASHGVAGFVRKPYEPEEIVEQIGRALAGRA
jgi:PAS domain S-box-containing protein